MARTILIVDDEPGIRDYLRTLFEDEGYAALEAAGGEEALALVRKSPPDLITLDIEMPGMSGAALHEALAREGFARRVPVIVITGNPNLRGVIPHVAAVFGKPFDRLDLIEAVRRVLGE